MEDWVSRAAFRSAFVAAWLAGTLGCSLDERAFAVGPDAGSPAVAGLDRVGGLALGAACSRDERCLSGACVDGVCCDAICDDVCAACNMAGNVGRCTAIEAECDVASVDGPGVDRPPTAGPAEDAPASGGRECREGLTTDCGTLLGAVGSCAAAAVACIGGSWSRAACEPSSAELCDEVFEDENCNGQSNEGPLCETFRSIAGGVNYLCGISTGGRVLCWGVNDVGQLGDGSSIDRDVPTDVVGLGTDTRSLVTSWSTACAISNAGTVSCWGDQLHWVRGGTRSASSTPVPATLFPPVLAFAIMNGRACAILPGQTLACSATDPVSPGAVVGITPIAGFEGIQSFGHSYGGVCGLIADGSVRCWSGSDADAPVTVPGLTGAVSVSGDNNSACAIVADGSVRCWGARGYSGLGQAASAGPMELVTAPGVSGAVAAFTDATGGCALSSNGTVQCWGFGDFAPIAAVQGVDLLASSLFGERVFVRTASGEVLGFSPTNAGSHPQNGNPTANGKGPYRLWGP